MNRTITNTGELQQAIEALEQKATFQKREMKEVFSGVMDNFKPINLVKQGIQSTFSGGNKLDLLKAAIGLGSGILGRKLLIGRSAGVLSKVIGAALEFGVVGMIAKNAEKIKEKGSELIEKIFHRRKSSHSNHSPTRNQQQIN